mgnify:CR=1 FL=1
MDKVNLKDIILAVAREQNFNPVLIEKDYYITIILNSINSRLSEDIVFKGGTLLNKMYLNYHRLSEDIDFSYLGKEELDSRTKRSRAVKPIRKKMSDFLKYLNLQSDKPEGDSFNNSLQYIFTVTYPSIITEKEGKINIEISLRQNPFDKPVYNIIEHFYKDPFSGEDLIQKNKIKCLSLNEAVAEKLKAAVSRRDVAIRDYFDLYYIAKSGFNFKNKDFISIFKKKLVYEKYKGDFKINFGLKKENIELLEKQIETDLMPVIKIGEKFDLKKVFELYNKIFREL